MKRLTVLLSAGIFAGVLSSLSVAQESETFEKEVTILVRDADGAAIGEFSADPESPADERQGEKHSQDDGSSAKKKSVRVEIHSSSESGTDDGDKPAVRVRGKVIVVGPDGKKSEYDLNDEQIKRFKVQIDDGSEAAQNAERFIIIDRKGEDTDDPGEGGKSTPAAWEEERFVIGVQCEEAGEVLRSHLQLGDKGVVVEDVREGTPAAESGLQKHDVIVGIDGHHLVSVEDLTKAVRESEGKTLELAIIRVGKPENVSVTPKKMTVPVVLAPATINLEELKDLTGSEKGGIRLQLIHPGVMLDGVPPHDQEAINKMIEKLRKTAGDEAARALEKAREEMAHSVRRRHTEDAGELHEQLERLQDQMRDLQKQLKDLQGRVKPAEQAE